MSAKCKLVVRSGAHPVAFCPVSVTVPWNYADCKDVEIQEEGSRRSLPAQIAKASKGVTITFLIPAMKPLETLTFIAKALTQKKTPDQVVVADLKDDGRVSVCIEGKPFTSYHYAEKWVRPFLHPVIGPYGKQITRDYPVAKGPKGEKEDHPHHKSIWIAHGDCNGVDNWSEEPNHGYQRHQGFTQLVSGPVFGAISAKNNWCAHNGRKQFEEVRDLRFYALPGGVRLFDIDVTFKMTQTNMTFGDTKEGGIVSVRVASSMDAALGGINKIENGIGAVNEEETWGRKAPWCDYNGLVDGKHLGIAVFDHEDNLRYPTNWHVRNYGLMTANPFGWSHFRPDLKLRGDMQFKKGSTTQWRYRFYIHKGDATKSHVGERFLDYIFPPLVSVE